MDSSITLSTTWFLNIVKEGNQAKYDLKVEGMETKLYLNNGMSDYTLALDDAPEK